MRLEQLQYVVETARCKSMSKAARNLYTTQPSLSTAIQNFEDELGFRVFDRSPQGCSVTEKGEQVLSIARVIVQKSAELMDMIETDAASLKNINLAIVPAACNVLTIELLTRLHAAYPLQKLNIIELRPHQIQPALVSGAADMAIGLLANRAPEVILQQALDNDFILEPVFEDAMYVYLSRSHPLAGEPFIRPQDLAHDVPILFNEQSIGHLLDTSVPQQNYYRFTEHASIKRAVAKGLGYAIMPGQLMLDDVFVTSGLVVARPLRLTPTPTVTIYLCHPAKKRLSAAERFIADTVRQIYKDVAVRLDAK